MVCKYCGKKLADGEVCGCVNQHQNNERSVKPTKKFNISIKLAIFKFTGLVSMIIATVAFLSLFTGWYNFYSGGAFVGKYSVLTSGIGDLHSTFLIAKIMAIIAIVLYAFLMFTRIFDIKGLPISANLASIMDIAFYASLVLSLFFGFIGCVSGDVITPFYSKTITMSFTWYSVVLLVVIGVANVFNPDVLKAIFTKSLMNEKR